MTLLKKLFGFEPANHSIKTEIIAGLTTFATMAYILAVNPNMFADLGRILGPEKGMPDGAAFTATALASIVGTLIMALYAKKPFGLAPGMGLNAFFVYTVCVGMGYSWQFALTAILIEGIIFIVLSITKVRDAIVGAFPKPLQYAIAAGIGLYIAFIGLQNAGIVVPTETTGITLGDFSSPTVLLAIIGLILTGILLILGVKGGLLIGILATTLIGIPMGVTKFTGIVSAPPSIAPIFCQFEWNQIFTLDMLVVVFTFLFIDMFDTMGTVIGVSQKAGFVDEEGNIDGVDRIFMSDAIGTVCGALLGTSTTTTYVESSAGVGAGGRTGLTAFTTAICFALALLFSPVFLAIPGAATAPSLIIVGMMMMNPVVNINWLNYRESIPAFLTVILMPLAYSISDGILIGMISYVVLYALSGKAKQITPTMWVLAVLFILRYIFM